MSKAEQYAAQRFPVNEVDTFQEKENEIKRAIFCDGYHQAEKDLELTWEDIRKIVIIYENVLNDKDLKTLPIKDGYTEVLKRFKERKEKCQ